jgi:hypothetical protein
VLKTQICVTRPQCVKYTEKRVTKTQNLSFKAQGAVLRNNILVYKSQLVPGSIPGHWGFFPEHQTVPCVLGSTQPLKMSTRILLGVKTAGA